MTTVTVLTPCLPSKADHLEACANSVQRAKDALPALDIEWVLVFDGPGEALAPSVADTVLRVPHQRGVSAARNYGLGASAGSVVIPLDSDDEIDPSGLERAVALLESEADLGWIACNRLLTTGERTFHWHGDRAWEPGQVAAEWSAPMQFHANTLVLRTSLITQIGGWPALGACEDLFLALRLGEISRGASISDVLVHYRAWPGQATRAASFRTEQSLAYDFIERSINDARRLSMRHPIESPRPLGGLGSVPV
ncbi:glycosyltransferase [Microbacterium sp. Gd 4-13]|uniref:glycosyltransferase family 2 protein n=1 Tax=Microbacterium sp. Gd 4-13 TaxID=2173179 RepID=UPI001402FAC2|nr:glycosyltransferase [Microbacterium sp. Gd 4-13]